MRRRTLDGKKAIYSLTITLNTGITSITINGTRYTQNTVLQLEEGTVVTWTAVAATGYTATPSSGSIIMDGNKEVAPKVTIRGYEFVDMGNLGIWATCNIGANSPEEVGLYFAWGETTGYTSGSEKSGGFVASTNKYYGGESTTNSVIWSKYTTNNNSSTGTPDNKLILDSYDDAARVIMGGNWRMPTNEEFEALLEACSAGYVTQNGVKGWRLTLNADRSKTLFFPAADYLWSNRPSSKGSYSYYWTSSLYTGDNDYAQMFMGYYSSFASMGKNYRYYGLPIRGFIPK